MKQETRAGTERQHTVLSTSLTQIKQQQRAHHQQPRCRINSKEPLHLAPDSTLDSQACEEKQHTPDKQ